MDQEKLGLFNLLLKNHYEENIHIDVVKVKRDKMMIRLDILRDAFKQKEYEKANFVLLDICDKVLNDPYADEYNMKHVEIDMTVFSSAITSITVRDYKRVQQITTGLIMKYRNPIFYYVLGISFFYELSFSEAQNQFCTVMQLLSENRNTKFPWPDTDILIIALGADKIREYALSFLDAIKSIQNVKCVLDKADFKDNIEKIEILKPTHNSTLGLNVCMGHFIQYEIYPHIQAILGELVKFDRSKLPIEYRKIINSKVQVERKDKSQEEQAKENKVGNTNPVVKVEKNVSKKTEPAQVKEKQIPPKVKVPDSITHNKAVSKKNQTVQTQNNTKCKQTQTGSKAVNQSLQTSADITGISDKCKSTPDHETISNLKMKLQQMSLKLRSAELKLSSNKNCMEVNEKNKLIEEQQDIITTLKIKLQQSNSRQNDLETKLNKVNTKLSELIKANKSIMIESEKDRESIKKYKETIADLRNYNQMLEKTSKTSAKKQEDGKVTQKNLFEKYRSSYFAQIQFYENFRTRCGTVLSVLDNIREYLTENTVPTKTDCQEMANQWLAAMVSCNEVLQRSQKIYNKHDKYTCENSLKELLNMAPMVPIKEPPDILLESIPILIYTIVEFDKRLQNNHSKAKVKNDDTKAGSDDPRNDTAGKTDYRKKSNFIHKDDEAAFSSDDTTASSASYSSVKEKATREWKATGDCENSLPNNKKFKSLLAYLKQNISSHTENDIIKALNICRQKNRGSLSGMTLQYILYNVVEIMETPEAAWSTVKEDYLELEQEKDVCPICIEVIANDEKSVLTCRHAYHTACIQEWFTINRVCAVCRKYTVLDEDFPPLKNSE